jgi:hypothetical protein
MMRIWILCLIATVGYSLTEIGTVVAIFGTVRAERSDGEVDLLERGAPVFLNDLLQVDSKSHAQIKLSDGSLFNLIPDTHYRVDQYMLQGAGDRNVFSSELLKGGLRGITGKIGKSNPDGVSVKTPTSVIGLRGTIFEIVIAGAQTFFGCESGEILISNLAGSLALGPRTGQQFGMVSHSNLSPQVLSRRPDALNLNQFILPRGCN